LFYLKINKSYLRVFKVDPFPFQKKHLIINYINESNITITKTFNENNPILIKNVKKINYAKFGFGKKFTDVTNILIEKCTSGNITTVPLGNTQNKVNKIKSNVPENYVLCSCIPRGAKHLYTGKHMRALQVHNELAKHFSHALIVRKINDKKVLTKSYDENKYVFVIISFKSPSFSIVNFKNKILIWDMIDYCEKIINKKSLQNIFKSTYKTVDYIITPNTHFHNYVKELVGSNNKCIFIPHNWDSRFRLNSNQLHKNEDLNNVKIGFCGNANGGEERILINKCKDITNLGRVFPNKLIGSFNVLTTLRCNYWSFARPSTKAYVAASYNCLILARSDEYGTVDLYGKDYPYYIPVNNGKSMEENLNNTIQFMIKTFKTPTWNKAIEIMKNVRLKTSLQEVSKQFLKLVLNHNL